MTLTEAIALATAAHAGQVDKGGRPYIEHPLRVMRRMKREEERMVAVLHDVVEDTPTSFSVLRQHGCPESIVSAVDALTKRQGESREEYCARIASNPLALVVKRADIADNSDPERLAALAPGEAARLRHKYAETQRMLDQLVQAPPRIRS
jgi:(p)ppGpp synthase/HD superfamily hydrolase